MEYKGYTARVEFDQEAGILHGEVEGLRDVITFEATDVRGLEAAFRASVEDYLAQCADDGVEPERPYSGKFLVRVDPRLHRDLAMAAARAGRSLNAFASDVFRYWVEHEKPAGRVSEASPVDANAITAETVERPGFERSDIPFVKAEPVSDLQVWHAATRDTPGSITPNTPAARTPAAKAAGDKAA